MGMGERHNDRGPQRDYVVRPRHGASGHGAISRDVHVLSRPAHGHACELERRVEQMPLRSVGMASIRLRRGWRGSDTMSAPVWTSEIRCPACKAFGGQHGDRDYRTYFELTCENCGAVSDIEVVAIPEFGATLRVAGGTPETHP